MSNLPPLWKEWSEQNPAPTGLMDALAHPELTPLTDISMAWIAYVAETGATKAQEDRAPWLQPAGEDVATPARFADWLGRRTGVPGWGVRLVGSNFELTPPPGYTIAHGEDGSRWLVDISKMGLEKDWHLGAADSGRGSKMNARRDFLKIGALFVPALAAPRIAYSFIWAPKPRISAKRIRKFVLYVNGKRCGEMEGCYSSALNIGDGRVIL